MSVIGYIRLNLHQEITTGLGLAKQRSKIQKYARENNLILTEVVSDQSEASTSIRLPGLESLIQLAISQQVTTVIVTQLDRLVRAAQPLGELLTILCAQCGVRVISLEEKIDSSSDAGQQIIRVIITLSQWEHQKYSNRTKEVVAQKRQRGEPIGHAPFGYRYHHKKLIPDLNELKIIQLIRQKKEQDGLSYNGIATLLNREHIPSKRGKKWYAETVKKRYLASVLSGSSPEISPTIIPE